MVTNLGNYSIKIFEKSFEGDVSKDVYLQVCNWLAKNVYSSPSYSDNISVQIKKTIKEKSVKQDKKEVQTRTVFTVSLYCVRDLSKAIKEHCDNCKHLHNLFFQMNDLRCDECRVVVLQKKLEREMENLVDGLRKSFEEGDKDA